MATYEPVLVSSEKCTVDSTLPSDTKEKKTISKKAPFFLTLLRIIGACSIIIALTLLLIEGWQDNDDLSRYFKLLALTGFITAAGGILSFVVKEVKGARIFFGLGLVSGIANFTILGALWYTHFNPEFNHTNFQTFIYFEPLSIIHLLTITLASYAIVGLLARFSFGIFARHHAARLSIIFLVINSLLLVPTRDAVHIALLASIALYTAAKYCVNLVKHQQLLLTLESKLALTFLFVPGLIIVIRSLGFYQAEEVIFLSVLAMFYYFCRECNIASKDFASFINKLLFSLQYASILAIATLVSTLIPVNLAEVKLACFSLVVMVMIFDFFKLNYHSNPKSISHCLTLTTVILVLTSTLMNLIDNNTIALVSGLCCSILLFLLLVKLSKKINVSNSIYICLLGLSVNLIMLTLKLVTFSQLGGWITISGLGCAMILLTSMYEKHSDKLNVLLRRF